MVSYSQGTLSHLKPPTDERKTKMITEKMLINMRRYWYSVARNDSAPAYRQAKISSIFFKQNVNQYKRPHTAIDKDMIDAGQFRCRQPPAVRQPQELLPDVLDNCTPAESFCSKSIRSTDPYHIQSSRHVSYYRQTSPNSQNCISRTAKTCLCSKNTDLEKHFHSTAAHLDLSPCQTNLKSKASKYYLQDPYTRPHPSWKLHKTTNT